MVDRHHLLLVDADVRLLADLGDRLQRDGFEVATARSGRDALAALDAVWPDLVILDLKLRGMSGEHLAARIKRRADIPIIVLSAILDVQTKVDLISRFAEDYVTKPFDGDELVARIRRVLTRLSERIPYQELDWGRTSRSSCDAGRPSSTGRPSACRRTRRDSWRHSRRTWERR